LGGLPKFYWDCQQDVRYFGFETQWIANISECI
jgi:hypothetical protein